VVKLGERTVVLGAGMAGLLGLPSRSQPTQIHTRAMVRSRAFRSLKPTIRSGHSPCYPVGGNR
jgi:hypothetical protein